MAFVLFGTGLLMGLIGLMELKIDQLNKVNYRNAIPIFIIIRTRKLQFCRSLIRQRALPFKDSGVRQQRFNDGAALCLGIFSNEQFPQPGAVEFAARVRSVAQR